MKKSLFACILLCAATGAFAQKANSPLTAGTPGVNAVHIMPTYDLADQLGMIQPPVTGALNYHNGPVMTTQTTYAIFWLPASGKLQNGGSTGMSAKYQSLIKQFLADYPSHSLNTNSTQYYQVVGKTTTYIKGTGGYGGFYVDTADYPASGCTDSVTPGNCLTDAQIQAEVVKVMGVKGWTGGLTHMFLVFTSSGEGSCLGSSCAYSQYCAYHGNFLNSSKEIIYGNEPYGDPTYCRGSQTDPNGDVNADVAVNIASHEMTEAATDPEVSTGPYGWYDDANGEEIGDLCAYNFGTNSWDSSQANEFWNGHYYDLQQEYDNHTATCVQVGP